MILGQATASLAGVFGFTMVLFGSIIGGGFVLSTGSHGV
jgi:hypothetical protein